MLLVAWGRHQSLGERTVNICIFLAARSVTPQARLRLAPCSAWRRRCACQQAGACVGSGPYMRVTLLHCRQVGALSEACAGTEVRWEHRVEAWKHPKVGAPSAWPGHAGVCMDWLGWGTHVFRTVSVN